MNRSGLQWRWLWLVSGTAFCGMAAAGCATGRTYVLEPAATHSIHRGVALRQVESTVAVEESMARQFELVLAQRLARDANLDMSDDAELQISYRFVLWDSGNAALRVGSGLTNLLGSPFYGAGDGAVAVDVVYTDSMGRVLGRIVSDGPISGALGSTNDGIKVLAGSVAAYTRDHFAARAGSQMDEVVGQVASR